MAHHPRRRERLLEELAAGRLSAVGIFGAEICQVCGRLDTFRGWAGAMATHRHGLFVGPSHGHRDREIQTALRRDRRFCEVCAGDDHVTVLERVGGRAFVHQRCREALRRGLSRRRYLEAAVAETDALADLADRLHERLQDARHRGPGGWRMSAWATHLRLTARRVNRRLR